MHKRNLTCLEELTSSTKKIYVYPSPVPIFFLNKWARQTFAGPDLHSILSQTFFSFTIESVRHCFFFPDKEDLYPWLLKLRL